MENIIEKFDSKYLKYFSPLVGGQYYIGDNGNYADFIYMIHDVLNFDSKGKKGKLQFMFRPGEKKKIKYFFFKLNTDPEYKNFIEANPSMVYLTREKVEEISSNYKEKLSEMLKAMNILILNYENILSKYKVRSREEFLFIKYFRELIKNLKFKNYYFFSGYNTHTVFICKYNDMIIIGNVGGGINIDDIDENKMVKAIKYYKFNIALIMILLFYNTFISEKLYIEIIKEFAKNEISISENKISCNVKNQSLKILHYDVILKEKHFYLKAQDKGTCTWHATFIADIFFNYYYPNLDQLNLPKIYQEKRNNFFQLLQNKKFNSFNVDNLNLKIIQYINLSNFKNKIIEFYKKDNIKYETDIFKYLYKEYFKHNYDEKIIADILINFNIKYEDIKNFNNTSDKIKSILNTKESFELVLNFFDEREKTQKMISNFKISIKLLDCYNSSSNCSVVKLDNLFISSIINKNYDITIIPELIKNYFFTKKFNKPLPSDFKFNENFIYNCRYLISNTISIYDKNNLLSIYCYAIFKKIKEEKSFDTFISSYDNFYIIPDNIKKFHNFIKSSYLHIEINVDNVNIIYEILKISYFLFQFQNIYKKYSRVQAKKHNFTNLFRLFNYDNIKNIYKENLKNLYNIKMGSDKEIIESNLITEEDKFKWAEKLYTELKGYSEFESKYVRINPIVLYKSNNINEFFIGMICAINFMIDPNIKAFGRLKNSSFSHKTLQTFHNPYIILLEKNDTILEEIEKIKKSTSIIIKNHIYENIPFNYFVLKEDSHIYNNYIYHILHNYDNLTENFFRQNIDNISLLSYSNYFVDTNNVNDSYNFNLEYSKDNFMDYIKLDTNYLENQYNAVLINLINKYTNSSLITNRLKFTPFVYHMVINKTSYYPNYYKKKISIHNYFKKMKIKGFEVVNTTIKYNGSDVQVENLYNYKFFKIQKSNETIFLLKDTKFKGEIILVENFLKNFNISNLKLKKKVLHCINILNYKKTPGVTSYKNRIKPRHNIKIYFIQDNNTYYFNYDEVLFKIQDNNLYINNNLITTNSIFEKHIYCYQNIFISGNKLIILNNLGKKTEYPIWLGKKMKPDSFYLEIEFNETFTTITNINEINYDQIKYCLQMASFFNDHYLVKLFFDVIKNYSEFYKDFEMKQEKDFKLGSVFVNSFYEILGSNNTLHGGGGKEEEKLTNDFDIKENILSELDTKEKIILKINPSIKEVKLELKNYKILKKFIDLLKEGLKIEKVMSIDELKKRDIPEEDEKLINIYIQNSYNFEFDKKKCNKISSEGNFFKKIDEFRKKTEDKLSELKMKIFINHYTGILQNLHYVNIITSNINDYVEYIQYRQINLFFKKCKQIYKDCNKIEDIKKCINEVLKYFLEVETKNKNITDILFEYHFGGIIYKKQKRFINNFYKKVTTSICKNNIYQLLPGWGKTKVLTPYLILDLLINPERKHVFDRKEIDGKVIRKNKNKVFVILPEHLVTQSFEAIYNLLYQYGINTKIVDFDENFINYSFYNENDKYKYFFAKDVKQLVNNNIDVCIISTYSLQYLLLISDLKSIKAVNNDNIFWIYDEVDFKQYKESEFNIARTKIEDKKLQETVLHYFFNELFEDTNSRYLDSDSKTRGSDSKTRGSDSKTRDSDSKTRGSDSKTGGSDSKTSNYLKFLVKYRESSLKLPLGEKYGIGVRDNIPLVVPYSSVNTPLINSSFSNIFFNINLNINYYKINNIHDLDLIRMIEDEITKINSYPDFIKNEIPNIFEIKTSELLNNDIKNVLSDVKNKLLEARYNNKLKKIFIKKYLIGRISKYTKDISLSSFFSLLSHNNFTSKDGIAFSGTTEFKNPFVFKYPNSADYYLNTTDEIINRIIIGSNEYIFNQPIEDDLSQGIILSNLYGLNQDEMKLLSFDEKYRIDNIIEKIFSNNIYIIIDVAAKFKDFKTEEIIDKMIKIYKSLNKNEIKYFFYIDKSKKVKIKNIETGVVLDYSKKYENVVGGLYTQADIVGIDIQLGKTSAIAIFKEDTTYTKIVQGMGRMRKLTTTQKIHLGCDESIITYQDTKNLSLIEGGKINHINLINFFKVNDDKEMESNDKYMYKHALFDLLGIKIIKLNVFEKPNFYNDIIKGLYEDNTGVKTVLKYLIDIINSIDSSNSTQQEQSQQQNQNRSQNEGKDKNQSLSKIIKVMENSKRIIIYNYSIFSNFNTNNFDNFYDSKSFTVKEWPNNELDKKIITEKLLSAFRSLKEQKIFISPMIYVPHYFRDNYFDNSKIDIAYYILNFKNNFIIISLKEYLDLMTIMNQKDLGINRTYIENELKDKKDFVENFKKYKLVNKDISINVSLIMDFITRYNMEISSYYLKMNNNSILTFYNYEEKMDKSHSGFDKYSNHFIKKLQIDEFIKVGEAEIKKILTDENFDDKVKKIIKNLFNIEESISNKYLINYKNKYMKYKKKYIKLKKYKKVINLIKN